MSDNQFDSLPHRSQHYAIHRSRSRSPRSTAATLFCACFPSMCGIPELRYRKDASFRGDNPVPWYRMTLYHTCEPLCFRPSGMCVFPYWSSHTRSTSTFSPNTRRSCMWLALGDVLTFIMLGHRCIWLCFLDGLALISDWCGGVACRLGER